MTYHRVPTSSLDILLQILRKNDTVILPLLIQIIVDMRPVNDGRVQPLDPHQLLRVGLRNRSVVAWNRPLDFLQVCSGVRPGCERVAEWRVFSVQEFREALSEGAVTDLGSVVLWIVVRA